MLIQLLRFLDSVAVVATICATVLLAKSCLCVTEEDDEVLEKNQLMDYYKKGLFILQSEPLNRCITVDRSNPVLDDCERPTRRMLWKWVSRHRLFNVGTSKCLGLNISDTTQPLGMFDCDMTVPVLWWRCKGYMLYGASQWKVAVTGRLVVVKRNPYTEWKRYNTLKETPCSYPYEDIHTLLGNAHGMPCAFPFRYNNKWYYECTTEGREDHLLWCATSTRYDEAERWGFCPVQDSSCERFWESNQELQACYQFNLYTILTWSQAMSTCQAQGGNLLSITSLAEHRYIRDRLASVGAMVWIGLNHLKDGRGWQWSDGEPLTLVNFTTALPASPLQDNRQCGVYNSAYEGHWQSLSCESALPYICKKMPNNTRRAEPLENWQYIHTECADGWWPHNGFCYRLMSETEAGSWEESSQACDSQGANLTSIHSMSEVENLLNLLANFSGESTEVWIGLWKQASSPTVEWSDGSPVALTLWHQYHPPNNLTDAKLCAKVDRKEGNWLLVPCDERLPAVCRKESQNRHLGAWDEGCPEGWKRHGHSCYTVTSHEQNFNDATQGYYCKARLLQLENRFEQAFVNSLLSESGANSSMYYWIDLTDEDEKGVYSWPPKNGFSAPLAFSNWNKHQPVTAGGCVAMSGGHALGRWEVKDCKSHKALSVCKQSISTYREVQLPEHHIDAYTPCPPGWESHSGLTDCFKVFHDEKVLMKRSWVEADFFCQALGAQLASFHHYEEQVFVKQLLSTIFEGTEGRWFWVGLNKRDPDNPGGWEWSDGAPVLSSFIDDKNEEDDRRDCAVYSDLTDTIVPQPCDSKHEWICKLYRGDKLKKPYWYTEQSEPWVFYRGAEYLLAKQPFDWDAVSLACQMMGAYLLSIHSKDEMHFIKERLRRFSLGPTDWWIGLTVGQPGEDAMWSDKTEVEFQNWVEGTVIVGPRKRMCVTMSSSSGKWSPNKCSDLHGYVCKRKTVSVVETPREPCYIGGCPEKWLYFGHKCLLLHLPNSPKDGKSWNDAQSICSSFEGSLIAIEDEIEQAYITMLLQGSSVGVWIGLWDEDPDTWTSGKKVSYTNWSPVSPRSFLNDDEWVSKFANERLCMVLSNNHNFHLTGKWYFERCSEIAYGFVCQKPQDVSKPPAHSCRHLPDNIEYRSHTYKVVSGNMSWYDAMHMCTENDSDLVSVTDAYHQAFLTVLVNRLAVPHWIGLYSQDSGINYQWSDGSDTVYTHWDAADDDEDIVNGECVYMDVNGGWRRADCETPLPGALCHVSPGIKPFISFEVVCPSTWIKFGQGCYNFEPVVERLTFEESREHCRQKVNTSDVLTIESETENRFVLEQLWSSGFPHHTVWLGMYFNFDTDSLAWVDGSPMEYTNWPGKAPDTKLLTTDTCVNTRVVDGLWYLSQCTERLGFVCKTISNVGTEVEVAPINGVYHGVIAAAVLVAVLVFALLAGAMWFMYKRNASRFQRLPTLGSAYYRQTSSQATESDGNVLITDLEAHSGE